MNAIDHEQGKQREELLKGIAEQDKKTDQEEPVHVKQEPEDSEDLRYLRQGLCVNAWCSSSPNVALPLQEGDGLQKANEIPLNLIRFPLNHHVCEVCLT